MKDKIEIEYKGRALTFHTRPHQEWETNISDEIVIREIFTENVYQTDNVSGVVVDIGANIGAFVVKSVIDGADKVIAYEPEEKNFELLLKNIKENGLEDKVEAHNVGIWSSKCDKDVYAGQGATIVTEMVNAKKSKLTEGKKTTPVKMIDINTILDQDISVLKIDCEWSEYPILESANDLSRINYLTMEFHSATAEVFGLMLSKLTKNFNIHIIGQHDKGGQVYANRY